LEYEYYGKKNLTANMEEKTTVLLGYGELEYYEPSLD